ncbi:autotransporter-associated beta strand repeat-containing protein [Cerasicoccus frondis]|uniref:autotransporter-associated beta strand repeat-containing protein n=1 Tax=Cerasicoccus frondis TaxID=490090 RepID=UPI002852884F|nr:autotransporter-associated beta strand repeat-containing protein [Cerasicoccus frondis]
MSLPQKLIGYAPLAALFLPISAGAQLVYTESFRYETAPGWEFQTGSSGTAPSARLTANAAPVSSDPENGAPQIDVNGNGWLRLATTTGNQANAVALDTAIPSAGNTIRVSFDYTFWKPGTNPADGITVFLWDAGQDFQPGAFGGSLGYAQKTGIDGLAGGYVGVGLDVYGNYSNATEGRVDGPGFLPNEVAVRGPGSGTTGYNFLEGTGDGTNPSLTSIFGSGFSMDFINSPTRPDQDADDFRHFEMELDASNNLTLWMQDGYDGTLTQILQTNISGTRPDQLRIGFSGATGGSVEVYEIRNLEVSTSGGTNSFYWDNENGDELWTTGLNWDQDTVPSTYSHVIFSDAFPDTVDDQTVSVDGGDKTISSATFSGTSSYELTPTGSQALVFDTDGNGKSYLNVLNNPSGNADHTVHVDIEAENDLDVQNLVDQTLTLTGDIDGKGNTLGFESAGVIVASGVITDSTGASDVVVTGAGETQFSGNNDYSGTTTVGDSSGANSTLTISHANALGATSASTTVLDGATLALAGDTSFANESLSIAGDGAAGTGALFSSSGSNTWNATTTLADDARIGVADGSSLTHAGNISMSTSGYDLTLDADGSGELTVSGVISSPSSSGGGITKTGDGLVILSGNNSYNGATVIEEGVLQINNSNGLGAGWTSAATGTTVQSGSTLALDNGNYTVSGENLYLYGDGVSGMAALWGQGGSQSWSGQVHMQSDSSIGVEDASDILTISNGFYGNGNDLTIRGDGTVRMSTSFNTVGDITIESGTLDSSNWNQISDTSRITINAGGTYDKASGGETIGSLAGAGNVVLGSSTFTLGGDNTSTTFSGVMSGTADVVKNGTGNMTFSGSNTMTGDLNVNAGTVTLGANNAFADSMDVTLNGGTFATTGFADTMDFFTLSSNSTIDFMGASGGYLTFDDMTRNGGTLTIDNWAGSLSGNGGTRLQVLDSSLGSFGSGVGTLSNITFTGYGGAELISLGGGVYEIVPDLSGFYEWTSSAGSNQDDWDQGGNWDGPSGYPDSNTAKAYIGTADANLDGREIDLSGNRTINMLVIDNDDSFIIKDNTLNFNASSNGTAYLTVSGGSSPTINSRVDIEEATVMTNNSTGTLTINGEIRLRDNETPSLTLAGSGHTVLNGNITDNDGYVIVNSTGTVEFHGNNSYDEGYTQNSGRVLAGHNDALGEGLLTFNGGALAATDADRNISETYVINNDFTFGNDDGSDLTLSGSGSLGDDLTLTVESGVTTTLSGSVSGNQTLTKEGDGELALTGNNSFDELVVNDGEVSSLLGGNMLIGGSGTGTSVFGDGDVTVNSGGVLDATAGGNVEIGDGATLANTGGNIGVTAGGSVTFDGDFTQSSGASTFTAGTSGDINTDADSTINISGGTVDFIAGDDFNTANNNAAINITNGATVSVDLSSGNTGSAFNLNQNDTLTVDGASTTLTLTTETNGSVNFNGELNLNNQSQITVAQGGTTFGANSTFDGGSAATAGTLVLHDDLTFTAGMDIANAPNITFDIASGDSANITAAAASTNIENLGVITKSNDGDLTIGSNLNNLQAASIEINGGTLLNSSSNQIENNTGMIFSDNAVGSTTPTWNVNDADEVLGTLTLNNDSEVNLDFGSDSGDGGIVQFADSSADAWSGSGILVIDNWNGDISGGGLDQLYIGSSSSGVTSSQIQRIYFRNPGGLSGFYQAQILSSGEIVPYPVPEPGTYAAGGALVLAIGLYEWRRRRKQATPTIG